MIPVRMRSPVTTDLIRSTFPMPFWVERIQVFSPITGSPARMALSVW